MSKSITIGADIGGGHILSAAIDRTKGEIIDRTRKYLKVNNKGTTEEILKTWSEALNYSISMVPKEGLSGIAFAMPGPFNYREGMALFVGNDKYETLYGMDVASELSKYLKETPLTMRFLNDATAFAVGEAWMGRAVNATRTMALTLGTGLGSAYIENGIPVVSGKDVAAHGCLWHVPYMEGIADDYFSTRWFINRYENKTGEKVEGVKKISELALMHTEARSVFEEFGTGLSSFLTPWLKKFKPDMLVLGGNIAKAMDLFLPTLKAGLKDAEIDCEIALSELMEDAALVGSTRLFEQSYWEQIRHNLPVK